MSTNGPRNFRPRAHFSARKNWINDPNGLIFYGGEYHMFFQYSPSGTTWGPMHWGHATSHDLVHWQEQDIALYPDALGTIFSGCAVLDEHNTSGLGVLGKPPLVLIFTHNQPPREAKVQQQSVAYSLDGRHFIKYPGNPVIPSPGIRDFRDPKVFWDQRRGRWSMVLAVDDQVWFYASLDLLHWEKTGSFGPGESLVKDAWWECPDLFELPCEEGGSRWVLMVSRYLNPARGGSRTEYFIGQFDGDRFVCTEPADHPLWLDDGFDFYAATSFSQVKEKLFMAWAGNWAYAPAAPTGEYCGIMALPRRFELRTTPQGHRLAQRFAGIQQLVSQVEPLSSGACLPREFFGLRIRGTGAGSVRLCNGRGEQLELGVTSNNEFFMDRQQAGLSAFYPTFAQPHLARSVRPRPCQGDWCVELVFDVSICEALCDQGLISVTQTVYPGAAYDTILFSENLQVEYIDMEQA